MYEPIFIHSQYGPYGQFASITVRDKGNGLPIDLTMTEGDPPSTATNAMSVSTAEQYYEKLGEAIEKAKEAGLD